MPAQITAFPTPPSTNDPANFNTRADAFLGQMPTFVTETNALSTEVYGLAVQVTADKAAAAASAATATAKATQAADQVGLAAAQVTLAAGQVTLAAGQVTLATTQAGIATTKASEAVATLTQIQNVASGVSFSTKSLTANTLGTGTKTWTVDANESFVEGMPIYAVAQGDPTKFMVGVCTSYAGATLTVAVTQAGGSGSVSNWNISIGGVPGVQGVQGIPGIGTPTGGAKGYLLKKKSTSDFDFEWAPEPVEVPVAYLMKHGVF
ncbi:hypothetical protein [Caulobacter sp.]|uniref:hypothetical protein n=1 Tax=Caulobacter sp. TaxID=78 RepID=UPI001AFDF17E|nr:hypothetical protein [Caulobacter sp.]MBO9544376.1 hypothetical protein [Caulobacter sp.]